MKTSNSFCSTVSASTQISILYGLDSIAKQVNEKFASDIKIVDNETLFSNHVLYVGITSRDVIYGCAIDSFIGRLEDLMFRNNVVCFARPVLFNFDFVNKVINIVAEFD